MTQHKTKPQPASPANVLVSLAALVIIVWGMRGASSLIVQLLLAIFVTVVCSPFVYWMRRRGLPTVLAVCVMILVLLAMAGLLGTLIGSSVADFRKDLPKYQKRIGTMTDDFVKWIEERGIEVPDQLNSEGLNPKAIMPYIVNLLGSLGDALGNMFIILGIAIFMLLEASTFPDKVRAAFAGPTDSCAHFEKIAADIRRYMAIKTIVSLLTGGIVTVALLIIGVDYAPLWGLLAFLLNYIPNIGSIIAAVPPVILALVQLGWVEAAWTTACFVVINVVIGNFVEPRFMGKGLGISTLVVFLSLIVWGWALGPVGMLLSAPLTMAVKIGLEANDSTRWLAILLAQAIPKPTMKRKADESAESKKSDQSDGSDASDKPA